MTTQERVITLLEDVTGVLDLKNKLDASFEDDFGWDSLDAIEILMACEEEFGTELNDEDFREVKTIQDVIAFMENALGMEGKVNG